jgi:hypothetical protein
VATALPLTGGRLSGSFSALEIGAVYQADQFPGADFGAKVEACLRALNATYGGTCDARNFTGTLSMGSNLTIVDGEHGGAAAVRDDCDGEPGCGDRGDAERGAARDARCGAELRRAEARAGQCLPTPARARWSRWAIRLMRWIRRASTWTT